ncbi:MAG: S9 family peptidase, partial [Candidatus Aegiribacteria sp.]|nr:S9 family peptidase [Candidatus Aegiribacteria sp.]
HYVDFGEETYFANTYNNYEFDTDLLRFGYTSMITPWSTFDYNMNTHESTLLKQREIPSGYDASLYNSERLWAPAGDGTLIPISLVYRRDLFHAGENPMLLYGYGSYGASIDPSFNFLRLSLLNRGFVCAIAHVRGGQEMGRHWYDDGKLLNKMNTFTDFIDCAEYLIDEGYCNEDLLFAMGVSAGGLLMGAVVNMRPDLWRGVVAGVPFVDVVTTMLDETIPLTTNEYEEWGNPNDPVYYEYMLGYSPYDNVTETDYPAMFVYAGLHDSQVGYWEPAKWVARLRDMKTDDNPLLLHTDMGSGHVGASGRFQWIDRITWIYAFILDQTGIQHQET